MSDQGGYTAPPSAPTDAPEGDRYGPDPIFDTKEVVDICDLILAESDPDSGRAYDSFVAMATEAAKAESKEEADKIIKSYLAPLCTCWSDEQTETLRVLGVRMRRYAGQEPGYFTNFIKLIKDRAPNYGIHW